MSQRTEQLEFMTELLNYIAINCTGVTNKVFVYIVQHLLMQCSSFIGTILRGVPLHLVVRKANLIIH